MKDPLVVSVLTVVKLKPKDMDLCMMHVGPDSLRVCRD